MDIHIYTWIITVVVLVAIICIDGLVLHHKDHVPTPGESARSVLIYVTAACLFGVGLLVFCDDTKWGLQYFSGYLTEEALSVDNLFLFLIIMEKQRVPKELQHFALTMGILGALVLRGGFIAVGAVLVEKITWIFFLFGLYLIYTAWSIWKDYKSDEDADEHKGEEGLFMRWIKKLLPSSGTWEHERFLIKVDGKRVFTLMFFAVATLETADLMFALDSIPAIFGLTTEPYIVFTASIFALMGLRQIFFLIADLLEKLQYLSIGLVVLLIFIGIKQILHALHHYNGVPGGLFGWVPYDWMAIEVPTVVSLVFIVLCLGTTALISVLKAKRDAREVAKLVN
ncbi:MAG: TerC/Alx family metal homeostasis membrane protein [Propionibacteriaceae bacterium]|nr:TerC/Alx family metal homeostasis membrane protein [Propionibacteriaceae bacterium]